MSKQRNKKHNPAKRFQRQAEAALYGVGLVMVWSVDGEGHDGMTVAPYNMKTGATIRMTQTLASVIDDCHFRWQFLLAVWSKEANGKERLHFEIQRTAPYRHIQLVEHLREAHREVLLREESRGNELLDAGWIAVPVPVFLGKEFPDLDETMERILIAHREKAK